MCSCNIKHSDFPKQLKRAEKYADFGVFFLNGKPYSKSIESILKDDNIKECFFLPNGTHQGKRTTKTEYLKSLKADAKKEKKAVEYPTDILMAEAESKESNLVWTNPNETKEEKPKRKRRKKKAE